jgi:hypothetical protein
VSLPRGAAHSATAAVGSITVLPWSRRWRMQSLIHSVCCCRQVVMLHSAADGARGTAVVRRPATAERRVNRVRRAMP